MSRIGHPLPSRGLALRGRLWPGGTDAPLADGVCVLTGSGHIGALGPADAVDLPHDLPVWGGPDHWVGPGVVDAHVHLAFGAASEAFARGCVAVRDLGAPLSRALAWRNPDGAPAVVVAGPVLTAPTGYPSRTWGSDGFAGFVELTSVRAVVGELVAAGVDLIKVALEPAAGQPVLDLDTVRTLVAAAHAAGLAVTAHALTAAMVERALLAGVDELCHVPVEPLPPTVVEQVATAGIPVVSTVQTHAGEPGTLVNAAALHAAGVTLAYGTDLGNTGTRPGVDPRELERLAAAGLGRVGALRAATDVAAASPGLRHVNGLGRLRVGERAAVVLLAADPLVDPIAWRAPVAVVRGPTAYLRSRGRRRRAT